jgi:hypothetical protein
MKVKSSVSKFLTNQLVLKIVSILALLNLIGYMAMGNLNSIVFFIILAVLVRYFSKNMIIVLGTPLILVNLFSLKGTSYGIEGFEEQKHDKTIDKINDEKRRKDQTPILPVHGDSNTQKGINSDEKMRDVSASNENKSDEHFEVGRPKNGGSKIDYAATIENAYDELNKVLGSEGMKSLTDDTQRLMKQQMELAKSMEGLAPMVEQMMPMAQKMQSMMESMDTKGSGMSGIMEMAQKMAKGLGGSSENKTA